VKWLVYSQQDMDICVPQNAKTKLRRDAGKEENANCGRNNPHKNKGKNRCHLASSKAT
jgi:hypothetical protein